MSYVESCQASATIHRHQFRVIPPIRRDPDRRREGEGHTENDSATCHPSRKTNQVRAGRREGGSGGKLAPKYVIEFPTLHITFFVRFEPRHLVSFLRNLRWLNRSHPNCFFKKLSWGKWWKVRQREQKPEVSTFELPPPAERKGREPNGNTCINSSKVSPSLPYLPWPRFKSGSQEERIDLVCVV